MFNCIIKKNANIYVKRTSVKSRNWVFTCCTYLQNIKIVVEYFHHGMNFFYYPEYYILAIRNVLKTDLSGLKLTSSPAFLQRENFLHSYRILFFRFSSHKNHTVWRACLVGSGQAPASTLLRSPGWCPVVLARSTPFLFSMVVRAKTFSINASFFLLLSAGRRVRAKAILKTPARCNKANYFSHA